MRSIAPMKAAKIGYIVLSVLMCAAGLMLILFPGISAKAIGIICGIMLAAFGIVRIAGYFARDLYRLAFQYDLASGLLMIALGIVMLLRPDSLMNFLCIVLGIFVLADGLLKIQVSFDARRFGLRPWWLILCLAIASAALGVVLVLCSAQGAKALTVLLGCTLLIDGILSLSTVITAVKIIKNQQPDVIEVEHYEEVK